MPQFIDFAVATAEWGATGSGVHEGGLFPSMARAASGGQVLTLPTDGSTVSGKLDHTGYVLFNVARAARRRARAHRLAAGRHRGR